MGQTIYRAGDSPDQFYVVVQGQVTLYDARDKDNGEGEGQICLSHLGLCPGPPGVKEETNRWRASAVNISFHWLVTSEDLCIKSGQAYHKMAFGLDLRWR